MNELKKKGSSVERVLQIVEVLASSPRPMSVSDLAETLDVPIPSMYRLLDQLKNLGFVQLDLFGKVRCGERTHKLVMKLWQNNDYKIERMAILQELSSKIGETVGISVIQDLNVVCIDRVLSDWPLQLYLPTGTHIPVWGSSSGKLFLSQLSDEKCERLVNKMSLDTAANYNQTDRNQLMKAINKTRDTKIGVDDEGFIPGLIACAVIIPNNEDKGFATLFIQCPVKKNTLEGLLSHVPVMREAARELSVIFNKNDG